MGGCEISLGGGDIGLGASEVSLHAGHIAAHRADLAAGLLLHVSNLLLGRALLGLLTLQLGGLLREFFLGHPQLSSERFGVGFGGLHAFAEFGDLFRTCRLAFAELIDPAAQGKEEEERTRHVDHREQDHDPLSGIPFRSGMFHDHLLFVRHSCAPG